MLLGYGEFTIRSDDTLYLWTAHVSGYDVDLAGLSNAVHAAQVWYLVHRPYPAPECCFTMPDGRKGDIDGDGKYSLNDVTKLIDVLYLGSGFLRCPASADTDCDCKLTLADITRLIGYIYIDGIPDRLCFCSESPPCPEF